MNRVLESMGALRMGRGSALVSLLAWGRIRSLARVAYDRLGLHGKVKVPTTPIDWAHTTAYTSVTSTGEGVSIALAGREPQGTVPRRGLRAGAHRGRGRAAGLRRPRHRPPPDRAGGAQGGRAARPVPGPRARPAAGAGPAVQPHARAPDRRAGRLAVGRPPAGGRLRRRRSRHRRRRRRGDLPGRLRRLDHRRRWASRSRPAPTRPSSRRWAYSRTTRSARSRSGSAVSAISTDRAARPQRGLPGHQPCGRHSRESTPSRTAATRNSTNNEITITAPMAHHPFQVWNGGDRRPVRNTMPT